MLLFRLILLFAVAFIAWRLYRLVVAPRMRGPEQPPSLRGEVMVECAFCSVHVPRDQAIAEDSRCSAARTTAASTRKAAAGPDPWRRASP